MKLKIKKSHFMKCVLTVLIFLMFIFSLTTYADNNTSSTTADFSSTSSQFFQTTECSFLPIDIIETEYNFHTDITSFLSTNEIEEVKLDTKNRIKEAISIKEKALVEEAKKQQQSKVTYNSRFSASESDLEILAKIIYAEARGESYQGKVAVGAVILNRVRSSKYPNTIKEVVFAPKQFSPVGSGTYYSAKPSEEEYNAAQEALSGVDPTNGALTFYAYKYTKSAYHESMQHTVTIGGHKFFK